MRVTETRFKGLRAVDVRTGPVRMVVVVEVGPRIAFYGKPRGKNLLFWDAEMRGRNDWLLRGGHRVWTTRPLADESEESYRPDNRPCKVRRRKSSLTVLGAVDPETRLQRGFTIREISPRVLMVDNFVVNLSEMLWSGGVWALTCIDPSGRKDYIIPLGEPDSDWDCFAVVYPRRWAGHSSKVDDPQISLRDEFLILRPQGKETKRMVQAPRGIIGARVPKERYCFFKRSAYYPAGRYPLNCNVAFYVGPGNFMVELETMGAERTLRPRQIAHNIETWHMTAPVKLRMAADVDAALAPD